MKKLLAPTEDFIKLERSTLTADAAAGSSVALAVANNDHLDAGDFIVIGFEGSETCEIQPIASKTGATSVTVATLKFNHPSGDPITKYNYDKRKFYGSATEDGSYTELTTDGSPVIIQVDDPQGTYLDYTGSTFEYFKATYYNSLTTDETDTDDAIAVEADERSRYASIFQIRKAAGIQGNALYSDLHVEQKRKQAEGEINSALYSKYTLPLSMTPGLINRICELLAAGYIMYEEFGADGDGGKMLGEARALLKAIADGRQLLLDDDGVELPTQGDTSGLSGSPDSGSTGVYKEPVFKMSDRY